MHLCIHLVYREYGMTIRTFCPRNRLFNIRLLLIKLIFFFKETNVTYRWVACLLSLTNGILVSTTGSFLKAFTASSFRGVWKNNEKKPTY